MRLIDTNSLQLVEVVEPEEPYAILSHRWEAGEVSFQDFQDQEKRLDHAGFHKIRLACNQAVQDGYDFVWVDTCCIDKSSSAELSEAINSMFNWYRNAAVCYAYLSDAKDLGSSFVNSKWFTRGWTLQELVAPAEVQFYSVDWKVLGEKSEIAELLEAITGIDTTILTGESSIQQVSIAARMSWAARRKTTRPEDMAYCLMGIFDVNMPMLYGEGGTKAFVRLQEEILKNSEDQSLFAWVASEESANRTPYRGLFASSPAEFGNSSDVVSFPRLRAFQTPMSPTNRGIPLTAILNNIVTPGINKTLVVGLNCHRREEQDRIIGVVLTCCGGDRYLRVRPNKLFQCTAAGPSVTVYVDKYAATNNITPVHNEELAFYFSNLPSQIRVANIYPISASGAFQRRGLLLISDFNNGRAVLALETPPGWTDRGIYLVLWAVRTDQFQTLKALFDVVLVPKGLYFQSVNQVRKPSILFNERVISFGTGKPSLAFSLEPVLMRGFDMFSIKVDVRDPLSQGLPTLQDVINII